MTIVPFFAPGADPERLLHDWMPGAWIGAVRRAIGPLTELSSTPQGEVVEHRPPQWLLALWPPQRLQQPFLRRWPQLVALQPADDEAQAVVALLRQVPDGRRLWVLNEELDWALMAEIVLRSEAPPPLQARALHEFIEAERAATAARIVQAYGDPREAAQGGVVPRPR